MVTRQQRINDFDSAGEGANISGIMRINDNRSDHIRQVC
jgi:hypothetical protein